MASAPRRSRTRKISSSMGRIKSPIDVRSNKHLNGMMDRIKAGPLTLVFVYANWCGHCAEFAPHLDEAIKSKNRSVQVVKVNDEMLPAVNAHLIKNNSVSPSPLNVSGYPSVILVDKQGNQVANIQPVHNTETMTSVVEKSGNLATAVNLENTPSSSPIPPIQNIHPPIASIPNIENDLMMATPVSGEAITSGGSFMDALSSTAYTLAPTAVLLAIATGTMKQKSKRSKKHNKTKKHSNKRHV